MKWIGNNCHNFWMPLSMPRVWNKCFNNVLLHCWYLFWNKNTFLSRGVVECKGFVYFHGNGFEIVFIVYTSLYVLSALKEFDPKYFTMEWIWKEVTLSSRNVTYILIPLHRVFRVSWRQQIWKYEISWPHT